MNWLLRIYHALHTNKRTTSLFLSLPNGIFHDLQTIAANNRTSEERLLRRIIVEWLEDNKKGTRATKGEAGCGRL